MVDLKYVSFHNWVLLGDYYYADNYPTNDVVVIDKESLKIVDIIELHIEKYASNWNCQYFVNIAGYDKKLYLFPYWYKDYMAVVDLNTRLIRYRKMSEICKYGGLTPMPQRYLKIGNKLIFLPNIIGDPVIVLNMIDETFSVKHIFPKSIIQKYGSGSQISTYDMFANKEELWFSVGGSKVLIQMNYKSKVVKDYCLEGRNSIETIFCPNKENVWYMDDVGNLCRFEQSSCKIVKYEIGQCPTKQWKIVPLLDKVVLMSNDITFPRMAKSVDVNSGVIEDMEVNMPDMEIVSDFRSSGGFPNYWRGDVYNGKIIFFPQGLDGMLLLDPVTLEAQKIELMMSEKKFEGYFNRIKKNCIFAKGYIEEEKNCSLKELLGGKLDEYF